LAPLTLAISGSIFHVRIYKKRHVNIDLQSVSISCPV
jgi:hypothetical protein